MHNSITKNIPPFSKEEIECLELLSKMTDNEIDLSDISEITHEEFVRARENRRKRLEPSANCRRFFC